MMELRELYQPIFEGAITVPKFKEWLDDPRGFENELDFLHDDIARMGGLVRYLIQGNRWIKSLDFPLVVYRGLHVDDPDSWVQNNIRRVGRDLGVYWTEQFEIAINQNGPEAGFARGADTNIVLAGVIEDGAVDWCVTLATRTTDPEEPEIRLIRGAEVNLTSVMILDTSSPNHESNYLFDHKHVIKTIPINMVLRA